MVEKKKYLTKEHLRSIIERASKKRLPHVIETAADLLRRVEPLEVSDFKCLARVSKYREFAIAMLVETAADATDLDLVFERGSDEMRMSAGRRCLDMPHEKGRGRCAKVAFEIPALREEAMAKILGAGPFDLHDLEAIWEFASPSVRQEQWQKFLSRDAAKVYLTCILSESTNAELVSLAWDAYKDLADPDDYKYYIPGFLNDPRIAIQVWKWIREGDHLNKPTLIRILEDCTLLLDTIWAEIPPIVKRRRDIFEEWPLFLLTVTHIKEMPRHIRDKAAQEIAEMSSDPQLLLCFLDKPLVEREVARKLLSDFELDPELNLTEPDEVVPIEELSPEVLHKALGPVQSGHFKDELPDD